ACNTSNCPGPGSPSTSGASILSTDSEADYTFMELDGPLPQGVYFMPWDDAPVANSDGTALHRVSHPSGEPQAYSTHDVDTSRTTCRSWPRGPWIYSTDTYGATEGGSSGSPVTNAAGDVVGQLSGACGFNTGDECDSVNNATVDGAFAHYYPAIEQWLDPTGCTPSPEVCDNGIDDDCDGQVDCDDDNCSAALNCGDTGGGGCGPGAKGDPCSSNDDCASCNCKRGSCKGG
ncbi:MAG: trypsin-like peptidase domain-containing protein, partial [Planctomycetota bacterium]